MKNYGNNSLINQCVPKKKTLKDSFESKLS